MSSAGQRGRAAISVLGLVAFVAGIPVVLLRVARARFGGAAPWHGVTPSGWTVPRALDSLTGRLTDATMVDVVIRVAVAIAWIATAVVVITVLLEAVHMRRYGLPRPRVRGFAWSQHLARTLAAGLLVLLPASGVGRASARTALESVRAQSSAAPVVLRAASSAESATDDSVADVVDDVYVVEVGDSIYGLAERLAGGDASRISAIATSLLDLNLGRTMPDGQRFLTAAYIEPGWTLQLPGRRPVPQPIGATSSGGHVVEPGETLSSIALDELADATRWEEIWSANAGRSMPDGRTFDDPNLIVPGWQLALPEATPTSAVTAPTPTCASVAVVEPIAPSTTSAPVTTAPEPDVEPTAPTAAPEPVPTAPPDRDAVADASQASPLGLEHAAMLGTGVLALVAAARRRRLRAAVPPSRLPVPSAESVVVERSLRVADAAERFLRLDLAVRAAAEPIVDAGRRVLAAAVGPPGDVVLWTDGGVELPAPWRPEGGTWLLPVTVPVDDLADAARRGGCPCVALVQVGVAADGADVYVDLEAAAVLSIEGCPAQADAVLAAMAMTLAASPLAEVAHLVDVGLPPATFLGHRHHHRCVSVSDAVTTATSLVSPRREASTFELRVRGTSGELWEPAVVLVSSDRVAEIDEHAVGAACAHAVALVAGGPVDGARMRLAQQDRRWTLAPLGIELTPIGLTSSDIDTVAALAVEADRPIEPDTPGVVPVETGAGPEPRDWSLMVRVLGPVDVVDASGEPAPV
ncbi:MAG TPA: LysM peptidoglycan-binding domain-containing protein, partial [Ilumatobacteraceae bacterium]